MKSAYARRLKEIDHNDPEQFQPLQQAFAAAKIRAKAREGKPRQQPGMAALMGDKARPLPDPEPRAPARRHEPKPDSTVQGGGQPAQAEQTFPSPSPPMPEKTPEQSKPPSPEPWANKPPVPKPQPRPKPAAKPWGTSSEYLDALYETDPWAAEQAFFKRLEAVLVWPTDIAALDQLMQRQIAADLPIKRRAERMAFNTIAENIPDYSTPMDPRLAALLEDHFQWSTDGVGLSRRFAFSSLFQRVVHCFSASRPSKGTSSFDMEKRPWPAMKIGLLLIVWLIVLSSFDDDVTTDTLVITLTVTLVFASIVRAGLLFLSVPIMLIPGVAKLLARLGDKIAPNFAADFSRNAQLRAFVFWVLSAFPVAALFLLT